MRRGKITLPICIAVAILIASFVLLNNSFDVKIVAALPGGSTLYVGGTGPDNYTKIQDAIDNASDGDTVFVYNGTYCENVVINKSINLIGEDRDGVVIDGNSSGYDVIYIVVNWVNVSNFTLINGSGGNAGVHIIDSGYCNVSNSDVTNNSYGIMITNSSNNTVINCDVYNNSIYGVYVFCPNLPITTVSSYNLIENCTVYNNTWRGIFVEDAQRKYKAFSNTISNCTVYNHSLVGIRFDWSENNVIKNCSSYNNAPDGIWLDNANNNSIENCNVFINGDGIWLDGTSSYNNISNCSVYNNSNDGVDISPGPSYNNSILYSDIYNNSGNGIYIQSANFMLIKNCTIHNNNWSSIRQRNCANTTISNCTIYNNSGDAISSEASSSKIDGSIILKNGGGIIFNGGDGGIINGNIIELNQGNGIEVTNGSNFNIIQNNVIKLNGICGLKIIVSVDNHVYHNNFVDNTIQAEDNDVNIWDNGYPSGGNYWSDYTGSDDDGDGIGDIPYQILGGGNQDNFPFMDPYGWNAPPNAPAISGPTSGNVGDTLFYETVTTDPDGDSLEYMIDWGDGNDTGWVGIIASGTPFQTFHSWGSSGTYYVRAKARDIPYRVESNWSQFLKVIINGANNPPNAPAISGPMEGEINTDYTFTASTTDPDNDNVKYYFDWDDGTGDWTTYVASGATASKSHIWSSAGTYQVKAKAMDEHGAESDWSPALTVTISAPNNPPNKPSKPSGPASGKVGEEYTYTTSTVDPDGDKIKYGWDWNGDKVVDEWTDLYDSGEAIETSHSWDEKGTYEIRVKAQDELGLESDWSDPLSVSMPKTYENPLWTLIERLFNWLEQLFERDILPGIFNL